MKEKTFINVKEDGVVEIKSQTIEVGKMQGLHFEFLDKFEDEMDKDLLELVKNAMRPKLLNKIKQIMETKQDISIDNKAQICWKDEPFGKLLPGRAVLYPTFKLFWNEAFEMPEIQELKTFLEGFLEAYFYKHLTPLYEADRLSNAENASGAVRGIFFRVLKKQGIVQRAKVQHLVSVLTQEDKSLLAKTGLRIGVHYLFFPSLLKPASQRMNAVLWKIWRERIEEEKGKQTFIDIKKGLALEGKMSFSAQKGISRALFLCQGYALAGKRFVRVDMLERFSARLREEMRVKKDSAVPFPMEALSLAGLKKNELTGVFRILGFKVFKKVEKQEKDGEILKTEVLMLSREVVLPKKEKRRREKIKQSHQKQRITRNKKAFDKDSPFSALAILKEPKKTDLSEQDKEEEKAEKDKNKSEKPFVETNAFVES